MDKFLYPNPSFLSMGGGTILKGADNGPEGVHGPNYPPPRVPLSVVELTEGFETLVLSLNVNSQ